MRAVIELDKGILPNRSRKSTIARFSLSKAAQAAASR
jgi:hypothetical protein